MARHARIWLWLALAAALAALLIWPRRADPLPQFPRVFFWAWERAEDLSSVDPHAAGVAFLARTVCLRDGAATVRPRLAPLRFAPGAVLMAVVRIESRGGALPFVADTAQAVVAAATPSGIRALQIDFDAGASERAFYRDLLGEVRRQLPAGLPLSITALASWCESDRWLAGLPVAEAVPMLFRMGAQRRYTGARDPLCQSSAGVSTDEPLASPPRGRRIYIFHPRAWTPPDLRAALIEVTRWQ